MAKTRIDTTYQTMQRDLFESGIVASIGGNAFTVWTAIKNHADFKTGECWPGLRRIAELTGNSVGTVHRYLEVLEKAKLLRVTREGRGNVYVARERMDVKMGDRTLCTIVVDYVPDTIRETLAGIEDAVTMKTNPQAFAACEIIPGDGFVWDAEAGVLRASIPASEVPEQSFLSFPQKPQLPDAYS
jgi:DNA-binding transcriptional regulator YhcF (GntR family)